MSKVRTRAGAGVAVVVLASLLISVGAVAPVVAEELPPGDGAAVAPSTDGTGGSKDGPIEQRVTTGGARAGQVALAPTACDPNSTWYTTSSVVKSGAVTNWARHVKNDATVETFEFVTTSTATVGVTTNVSGTLSASAALKKVAEVALDLTAGYGLSGQYASTVSYKRTVTFNRAGKWVIWAGVYTGRGTVTQKKCSSSGQTSTTVGSGTATTFEKARTTGLTNCANSVSDLVELRAKAKC